MFKVAYHHLVHLAFLTAIATKSRVWWAHLVTMESSHPLGASTNPSGKENVIDVVLKYQGEIR